MPHGDPAIGAAARRWGRTIGSIRAVSINGTLLLGLCSGPSSTPSPFDSSRSSAARRRTGSCDRRPRPCRARSAAQRSRGAPRARRNGSAACSCTLRSPSPGARATSAFTSARSLARAATNIRYTSSVVATAPSGRVQGCPPGRSSTGRMSGPSVVRPASAANAGTCSTSFGQASKPCSRATTSWASARIAAAGSAAPPDTGFAARNRMAAPGSPARKARSRSFACFRSCSSEGRAEACDPLSRSPGSAHRAETRSKLYRYSRGLGAYCNALQYRNPPTRRKSTCRSALAVVRPPGLAYARLRLPDLGMS